MAGLVCGLGLVRQWRRYRPRYENGRPGLPAGSPAEIRAERESRRAAVVAMTEEAIDEAADPARVADIKAGLAVRLQEPDIDRLLDTASTGEAMVRRCRSLGFDPTPTSASRTAPAPCSTAVERRRRKSARRDDLRDRELPARQVGGADAVESARPLDGVEIHAGQQADRIDRLERP
ncbi:hypothetical protein QFZ27_006551 [Inquilinus ginsengisoli]